MTPTALPAALDKNDAKRRQILEAARRLLIEKGFQDIVLDHVARKADVAKGTLYLYFKSKEELLAAVFDDMMAELGDLLDGVLRSPARGTALITDTTAAVLAHFDRHRDFLTHFTSGKFPACGTRINSRLMERYAENFRRVEVILGKCAETPEAAAKDSQYAAIALMGLCRAALIQHQLRSAKSPLESEAERVAAFFLKGWRGR